MRRTTWRLDIRRPSDGPQAPYKQQTRCKTEKEALKQAAFYKSLGYDVVVVKER